ncbi:MAG: hypothetical protein WAP52_02690 [Candidatus Sungiibacteriota bacterium]
MKTVAGICSRQFCFSPHIHYTDITSVMMTRDEKYIWTHHSQMKMRYYHLTESRIKRVIRYPLRIEESIVEGAVACMQPAEGKQYSEIWAMYVLINAKRKEKKINPHTFSRDQPVFGENRKAYKEGVGIKQMKIITVWRYPGKSPEREPVPAEILREIKNLIHSS